MHLEATDWEGLKRIHLAQDGKRRGVLADTVLNLLFPQEERNGLSSCETEEG
jgi:hypothetical protein